MNYDPTKGILICVTGLKGGVGKTTIATNLAIAMKQSSPNNKILLVDSKPLFGDVGTALNLRYQYHFTDLLYMVDEEDTTDEGLIEQVVIKHELGIDVLASPLSAESIPDIDSKKIATVMDELKSHYDTIIVDTGTTIDDVFAGVITEANHIILVLNPDLLAMKSTCVLLNELAAAELAKNVSLVVNKVTSEDNITVEQIEEFLDHTVAVQLRIDPQVTKALNEGVPIITYSERRAPIVADLKQLAQYLQMKLQEMASA